MDDREEWMIDLEVETDPYAAPSYTPRGTSPGCPEQWPDEHTSLE
jgi:hypothetical protein